MSTKLFMKPITDFEKAALEIYVLYREHSGVFAAVSGNLGRSDSSKLSRQLNPTDDRRDNPFVEVLEILFGTMQFSPGLEAKVWGVLERERSRHRKDFPTVKIQTAELMESICDELGDVVKLQMRGNYSQNELEKEGFELLQSVRNFYEKIKEPEEK